MHCPGVSRGNVRDVGNGPGENPEHEGKPVNVWYGKRTPKSGSWSRQALALTQPSSSDVPVHSSFYRTIHLAVDLWKNKEAIKTGLQLPRSRHTMNARQMLL